MTRHALTAIGVLALALASVVGLHAGSSSLYLAFVAAWALFASLAFVGEPSVLYSMLGVMWTLGFPVKLAAHLVIGYPWQEPVGDFAGTPAAWDAAMRVASVGLLGAAAGRVLVLALPRPLAGGDAPRWYRQHPGPVWAFAGAGLVGVAVVNAVLFIYRIGINPVTTLPLRGHVAVAWVIVLGGGLGVAALIDWELRRSPGRTGARPALVLAVCAEAVLASVSALSRGIVMFRLAPYWLLSLHRVAGRVVSGRRPAVRFALLCAAAFAATLAVVTVERAVRFRNAVLEASATSARPASSGADASGKAPSGEAPRAVLSFPDFAAQQLRNLLVDRWIGLEGVMTVTAATEKPTFGEVLVEGQDVGIRGWYQRMARPPYGDVPGFTFLALPGALAVLALGGSLWVVGLGAALGVGALGLLEWSVRRVSAGPHLPAMASVALANYFAQMHLPVVLGIVFIQLAATIGVLALLQRPDAQARGLEGGR